MDAIKVMVNGIPGNMAVMTAEHISADSRFSLIPQSLTGPEIVETTHNIGSEVVTLVQPDRRDQVIAEIKATMGGFITIDYTHPTAVNGNAEFYCTHNLPFVMGTTGGDREHLNDIVRASEIPAIIAPNMAKQIVGFQALMAYGAEMFEDLFKGYTLEIVESHQKGKADTSGTAKAMVGYFNTMGVPFSEHDIQKERDPDVQKGKWGIPEDYLGGHAWHTYRLVSDDGTVCFEFTHNVNGRDIYARGTLDAVSYLHKKIAGGVKGEVFTMIDVLKNL